MLVGSISKIVGQSEYFLEMKANISESCALFSGVAKAVECGILNLKKLHCQRMAAEY